MKTKWTLLLTAALLTAPALAQASDLPMVVGNVTGNMHIFQATPSPCPALEADVPVARGHFEITPAEGRDIGGGNRGFLMTRGFVTMQPFTLSLSCAGLNQTRQYTALSVQVAKAVSFVGVPSGGETFAFAIPPRDIILHEAATVNGTREGRNTHPRDPVTGTIDLAKGTVSMAVVVGARIHVDGLGDFDGSQTTTLSGQIRFPDTDRDGVADRDDNCRLVANSDQSPVVSPRLRAPVDVTLHSCQDRRIGPATAVDVCEGGPVTVSNDAPHAFPLGSTTVTWTATDSAGHVTVDTQRVTIDDTMPPGVSCVPGTNPAGNGHGNGGFFHVSASDHCDIPTIRLGSFVLGRGETIKITETGQPGVRLVNVMGPEHIRHFQVGRGQAVITATDGSGNAASDTCR